MPTWWLNAAGHWAGSVPDTLFSLSRESQLLKLGPQLCPAYSVWPRQLPFTNWLVLSSTAPRPVQLWFKVKVLHKLALLSGACTWPVPLWGSPKQSLLQFLPVGKLSLVWAESPQAGVTHHRATWCQTFSSPARAPREELGNHPRAPPTARPHMAFYSCSFWGLPLPVALETLGLLCELWEAGRLCCCPTRRISKEGEVRSREERPALMEVEQKSESGLTCLLLWWWPCWAKETWHFWVFPSEQWSFLSTILVSECLMHQHRLLHRKNVSRKQWAEGHVPGHQEIAYQVTHVREQERKAGSLWIKARACPRFCFYSPFPISLRNCWLQCLRCYSTWEKYQL